MWLRIALAGICVVMPLVAHADPQSAAVGAPAPPSTQAAGQPAPPPAAEPIPESVTRETFTDDAAAVARVDNQPIDPSLKGFFLIPGTETRLRIGGLARVDLIHDFQPIGSTDDFVVSTIPVGVVSSADNTTIHARQTRVDFEFRRPSSAGDVRAFFENDFFGSAGERAFNLRHAYGQIANLLGGFTNSTLQDVDARPDTLDYEGPPGRISARQAQFRYTRPLTTGQSLAFGIEEPKPDIPTDEGNDGVTVRTPWPDVVVRYRLNAPRGHLQLGGVVRSLGGFVGTGTEEGQVAGGGVVGSGSWSLRKGRLLLFEAAAGRGLARYVKDTSTSGLDLAVDSQGRARALGIVSAVLAYQHSWSTYLRSTLAGSFVNLDTLDTQPGDTYRRSTYLAGNVLYRIDTPLTVGVEYDYGRLTVKSGHRGSAHRVQIAVRYDLVE